MNIMDRINNNIRFINATRNKYLIFRAKKCLYYDFFMNNYP